MSEYILQITLLSDTTLGRGVGLAGLVDVEVEHDEWGLPYLHGRGVKGLLRAASDELASMCAVTKAPTFKKACDELLGMANENEATTGLLHIGSAQAADESLRIALLKAQMPRADVLNAFTSIRRQTSIDENTGAAQENTLRSIRVLKCGLVLRSLLSAADELTSAQKGALAAMVSATRRIGTRRNRGLGKVRTDLLDSAGTSVLADWLKLFEKEVPA